MLDLADRVLAPIIVAWPVIFLVVAALAGVAVEQRHNRSLTRRESVVRHIVVTDLKSPPEGTGVRDAQLVAGNAVIGVHKGKQLAAQLRGILGGEVRSLGKVFVRGRRDAYVRMLEQARDLGAAMVVNVRFETARVGGFASEVLCYGTALQTLSGGRQG